MSAADDYRPDLGDPDPLEGLEIGADRFVEADVLYGVRALDRWEELCTYGDLEWAQAFRLLAR